MKSISPRKRNRILLELRKVKDIPSFLLFLNFYSTLLETPSQDQINHIKKLTPKSLAYLIYKTSNYKKFEILKKDGRTREINSPTAELKIIQRIIKDVFERIFIPRIAAHGFVQTRYWITPQRSIVTNAMNHVNKKYILNIDILNFFPSINFGRISAVLQLEPFKLSKKAAELISQIVCLEGSLPQGAPTSPIISNIVCQRLDRKLVQYSQINGLFYSRYADDLTFSTNRTVINKSFIDGIKELVSNEGFILNNKKTRIQKYNQRQEVTGIIVNKKLNVPKSFKKDIRFWLHLWEKKGYQTAKIRFSKKYSLSKEKTPKLYTHLNGKLEYFKMIRGENDLVYIKLKTKFRELFFLKNLKKILDTLFIQLRIEPDISEILKINYLFFCEKKNSNKLSHDQVKELLANIHDSLELGLSKKVISIEEFNQYKGQFSHLINNLIKVGNNDLIPLKITKHSWRKRQDKSINGKHNPENINTLLKEITKYCTQNDFQLPLGKARKIIEKFISQEEHTRVPAPLYTNIVKHANPSDSNKIKLLINREITIKIYDIIDLILNSMSTVRTQNKKNIHDNFLFININSHGVELSDTIYTDVPRLKEALNVIFEFLIDLNTKNDKQVCIIVSQTEEYLNLEITNDGVFSKISSITSIIKTLKGIIWSIFDIEFKIGIKKDKEISFFEMNVVKNIEKLDLLKNGKKFQRIHFRLKIPK